MKRRRRRNWKSMGLRFQVTEAIFALFIGIFLVRSFMLQVLEGDPLRARALRQHEGSITIYPPRGTITDRHGDPLAFSLEVESVYVHPREVHDKKSFAKELAPFLSLDSETILAKLDSDKPFVWLERRLPEPVARKIRARGLPGIGFVREHRRFYPNRGLAAHLLGFAGIDSQGLEGIEFRYDDWIRGKPQRLAVERDALGRSLELQPIAFDPISFPKELRLTIDRSIQYIAEAELERAVRSTEAKAGVVIALDPWSGEILAMAVQPSFNPNIFWEYEPSQWRNRAVTDSYEPGSTFKAFLIAAALEAGVLSPEDSIYCEEGEYRIGGHVIHDVHPHGWLTVPEILKYSSNICVAKISQMLGRKAWYEAIRRFGFGALTEIDLPFESAGLVRPPEEWHPIDEATSAFGQGLSVSPIQLVRAMAAIANGGYVMRPYMVREIRDPTGAILLEQEPRVSGRAISEQTAIEMKKMLQSVVDSDGTGGAAQIERFSIAGKTGTAQKIDPETKRYSKEAFLSSFIGFFPVEDPRMVLLVMIDEPKGGHYGGVVAAPVFKRIAEQAIVHLDLPVAEWPPLRSGTRPVKVAQSPAGPGGYGTSLDYVPNLLGMSLREVLQSFRQTGIPVRSVGHGFVVDQKPLPGSPLAESGEVWVELRTENAG